MTKPVSVMDVAEYILDQQGEMTTWKLQKLCYYAQAWSLVWDDEPLFQEHIEAWANGPVVPELYNWHKGHFRVSSTPTGDSEALDKDQEETVDAVLMDYGGLSAAMLSGMTHQERPWRETRRKARLLPGDRGHAVITLELMNEYYSGIYNGG